MAARDSMRGESSRETHGRPESRQTSAHAEGVSETTTGRRPHEGAPAPTPGDEFVTAVEVVNVSKAYGAVRALRGVSMAVRRGEIHGLCGHNGAGKSTLVKVLVGLVHPDEGEVRVDGQPVALHGTHDAQRHGIALVDQELSLVPDLTVAENLFLGSVGLPFVRLQRREHQRARALLHRVGLSHVSPRTLLQELSMGERQLIEIARLLGRDAKLLILDEPTATLTDAEIERVFAAVRAVVAGGASVIFVSHRLGEVLSFCDRVTVFRDGALVGTRSVQDLKREDLVGMMLGEQGMSGRMSVESRVRRDGGVRVEGLTVPGRLWDFDLTAQPGTVIGLAGQIGSGASEVLRAIAGLEPRASGLVAIDDRPLALAAPKRALRAGVHFVSNDRKGEGLFLEQSIADNLLATRLDQMSFLGVLRRRSMRDQARSLAELVGVDVQRLGARVGAFSGGNQQKVFVGRCLDRPDLRLLLLDDPTRGVDVGGRAEIHRLVKHAGASGATVLFASSELDEILELSDEVVVLFAGRVVARHGREQATAAAVLHDMTHKPGAPERSGSEVLA